MYYLTFYLESTRAKIDFYSERLKQLAGTSFPTESNNDEHNKGRRFSQPIYTFIYSVTPSGQTNVSSSSKEEEKGKEPEKKDNEAEEKGGFIC